MKVGLIAVMVGLLQACGRGEPAAEPSEADYAARLIAALHDRRALHFDAEQHAITDGSFLISTGNLYREWIQLPASAREDAIGRAAATFAEQDGKPLLSRARPNLVPVVRASMYFDSPGLMSASGIAIPHLALGSAAGVGLAIDSRDSLQILGADPLAEWHTSVRELLPVALENLRAKHAHFEQVMPGVWAARGGDTHDAARLLLVDEIAELVPEPVAMIPNRETLLFASGKDAKALLAMATRAEHEVEAPRPIHAIALCMRERWWSDCEPAITAEVKARFHALALGSWASLYEEQRPALQRRVGDGSFVASYVVVHGIAAATLTKGVPTLLPRVDQVALVDLARGKKALGFVRWDALLAAAGEHARPDDHEPRRWVVDGWFPSDAELARMQPSNEP